MQPSTHFIDRTQEPVDITDDGFATELCGTSEVREFLSSLPEPEPEEVTAARWQIIEAYENGAIGAADALKAFEVYGCLSDADEVLRALCAGYRANLKLGDIPPVHPGAGNGARAAIPTVSNAAPFEPQTGRAA